MEDSIFTKIIKGEVPSYKVYEDDKTLAFLDIHPIQPGHTLVIPKQQIEFLWDVPDDSYLAVMETAKKVALRIRESMPQRLVHMGVVGLDVPHAHVHLIPFNSISDLSFTPDPNVEPDHDALTKIAEKLRFI